MEKFKQELRDFVKIASLLLKGEGSLSDYLLVGTPFVAGLLVGSIF